MASQEEKIKALKAKNRLANTSEESNSTRAAAHAALEETHGIITREMIDKEAKVVAARQRIDRARTASRAEAIANRGTQANHSVTQVDRKTGKSK